MTMLIHTRLTRLALPAALLLAAGCFKLSRESPPLQQFVLSGGTAIGAPAAAATARADSARLTVGLRRIDLASYLSVPSIVVRRGVNEVVVSEFHRWGEDIGEGINRVVALNLAGVPPVRTVEVAPWAARARHNFVLQLHVSRFEGVVDSAATQGRIHVLAAWDIIRPLDGAVLIRGSSDHREGSFRAGDYAGLVTGLDAALALVARDISGCLSRFRNDSTPPASCAAPAGGDRAGASTR